MFKPLTILMTIVVAAGAPCLAQAQDMPSGESVLEKYIEASGGQKAYDSIKNRVMKARLEIVAAGIELSVTTTAAKPNKVIAVVESEALGQILRGCTGKYAWSMSDMQGPVLEQGAANENRIREALFDRMVYWKKAYKSAECVSVEQVNETDCYKVVLQPTPYKTKDANDDPSVLTVYFDKQTFLPSKLESNIITEAGPIDVTAHFGDYKDVDGIKIAHKIETNLAGQDRVMTIDSVEHNVDVKKGQFDPPAEIQALIEKGKG